MLGKLLKYELKATGRTFLPLYGAILIIAFVNRLIGFGENFGFIQNLAMVVLVSLFIALGVMTLVVLIQRFNKNLLGDEGYLMFTLPVKTHSLVSCKLITTLIWTIASGIVAIGCVLILISQPEMWKEILNAIQLMIQELGNPDLQHMVIMGIEMVIIGIVNYIIAILTIYTALSTTQIAKFNKHKVPVAFVTFFVLNTFISWITVKAGEVINKIIQTTPQIPMALAGAIVWSLLIAGILFVATNTILKKHLNLN